MHEIICLMHCVCIVRQYFPLSYWINPHVQRNSAVAYSIGEAICRCALSDPVPLVVSNNSSGNGWYMDPSKIYLVCYNVGASFAYQLLYLLDATGFYSIGLHALGIHVCRATGQELV